MAAATPPTAALFVESSKQTLLVPVPVVHAVVAAPPPLLLLPHPMAMKVNRPSTPTNKVFMISPLVFWVRLKRRLMPV